MELESKLDCAGSVHSTSRIFCHIFSPKLKSNCPPHSARHLRFCFTKTDQFSVLAIYPYPLALGIPDLLFGGLIIGYAGDLLGLPLYFYRLGIVPLLFGFVILYSLWFMLGAMSICVKIYNVTEVLRGLLEAGRFPMVAYPTAYRFFFTFVVPVTFLTTVPAEAFLGRGNLS